MSRTFKKRSPEWELMTAWWKWLQAFWDDGDDYEKCDQAIREGTAIWEERKGTNLESLAKDLIRIGLNQIERSETKVNRKRCRK